MFKKDLISVTLLLIALFSIGCKSQHCPSEGEKVTIICSKIENYDWSAIGTQLTCYGDKSIKSAFSSGSSVSSVVHGDKSEVKNLAEITGLNIRHATVKFIPSGIKSKFVNLKALEISNCGLLSVKKENLKEFGNSLERLDLDKNKLISIDADLFEYNSNLKYIYLNNNPIRHIDAEFFTNLKKLKNIQHVELDSANCMDQKFYTSFGQNIQTFKWENEECTDSSAKVETKKLISDNICTTSDEKISNLKCEIIRECDYLSANISDSVGTANSALKNELKTLISAQEEKLTTLTDKTKESVDKLEKSIITLGDKLRAETEENKKTFTSTLTEQHGSLSHSIKALESELKTSINAQDDKIKTLTQNTKERFEKLENALQSSVKALTDVNIKIQRKLISDNYEIRKSIGDMKLQMAQMAEESKKTSEALENIKTAIQNLF